MNSSSLPKILITNDDGVHSPGILAAINAVSSFAEVMVLAPASQQTAMGRAYRGNPDATLVETTLTVRGVPFKAFSCEASPARTIDHGLTVLSGYQPDFIISGINYGENLGSSITSSGTVGAAMEAAHRGIPSIAVSLETPVDTHLTYTDQDWTAATYFLQHFTKRAIHEGFPQGIDLLKIDVPSSASTECPWRVTRLSHNSYYRTDLSSPSMESRLKDYVITKGLIQGEPEDTDIYAIAVDKVVSVTPLRLDFTAHGSMNDLHKWGK
ncbi:5'/3'-nucleotidase SurE [Halodesulfovibrio marinisediminis]|uniref:5'-nucleotidase n=1 Tax=Halodesulfovibrio marinisediminis DSM 17456 TaxID=1121457 RepID=A0A1N6E7B9_9BACT|nr:5'/3'-nucleotidase SurE [Halodesulfovibrio marinisediminis]SIN78955.1 5'-nucleotidase /3'-nucleotidase /exopolyphosphatase [Halodesulfovibrio marinisediminis DSM 17456]